MVKKKILPINIPTRFPSSLPFAPLPLSPGRLSGNAHTGLGGCFGFRTCFWIMNHDGNSMIGQATNVGKSSTLEAICWMPWPISLRYKCTWPWKTPTHPRFDDILGNWIYKTYQVNSLPCRFQEVCKWVGVSISRLADFKPTGSIKWLRFC